MAAIDRRAWSRFVRITTPFFTSETRWRAWTAEIDRSLPFREPVVRSLLTLRLLTYSPSQAPVAAPTLCRAFNPNRRRRSPCQKWNRRPTCASRCSPCNGSPAKVLGWPNLVELRLPL